MRTKKAKKLKAKVKEEKPKPTEEELREQSRQINEANCKTANKNQKLPFYQEYGNQETVTKDEIKQEMRRIADVVIECLERKGEMVEKELDAFCRDDGKEEEEQIDVRPQPPPDDDMEMEVDDEDSDDEDSDDEEKDENVDVAIRKKVIPEKIVSEKVTVQTGKERNTFWSYDDEEEEDSDDDTPRDTNCWPYVDAVPETLTSAQKKAKLKPVVMLVKDDPEPIKRGYFEPAIENCHGTSEVQARYIPIVEEPVQDFQVINFMFNAYDRGIHGVVSNKFEISSELLFQYFCELLPETVNPDLLYYCLYLTFPNTGTQKEFSKLFPKLAEFFEKDPDELERLLKLEHWIEEQKPLDNPDTVQNHFKKLLFLPNEPCSGACFLGLNFSIKFKIIGENPRRIEILVPKNIDPKKKLWGKSEEELKEKKETEALLTELVYSLDSFCEVATCDDMFAQKSCMEWFRIVMDTCKGTEGELKHQQLPWKQRYANFKKSVDPKSREIQLAEVTKCGHVGPCAPENEDCDCLLMCSAYCNCDENCVRRFPGCNCQRSCEVNCPCALMDWECSPMTCNACITGDDQKTWCPHNTDYTCGVYKKVVVKASPLAGNGAFIEENAKKDEFIGEYIGEIIDDEEAQRRAVKYEFGCSYLFELCPPEVGSIDSANYGNVFRFLNHADGGGANVAARYRMVEGTQRIGFFATKDLKKGQELYLDYGYSEVDKYRLLKMTMAERFPSLEPKYMTKTEKMREMKRERRMERESQPSTSKPRGRPLKRGPTSDTDYYRNGSGSAQPSTSANAPSSPMWYSPNQNSMESDWDDNLHSSYPSSQPSTSGTYNAPSYSRPHPQNRSQPSTSGILPIRRPISSFPTVSNSTRTSNTYSSQPSVAIPVGPTVEPCDLASSGACVYVPRQPSSDDSDED